MVARPTAIGIDLGTTYACVGVFQDDKLKIIPNDYGNNRAPSYVAFTNNERFIGNAAKYQQFVKPVPTPSIKNTIYNAKRLIGCHFSDHFVQDQMKHWPFEVLVDDKGNPNFQVDYMGTTNKKFSPEEILGMLLLKMKETAATHLGLVTNAVISVPASFNNRQRQAVVDAATIAGLEVLRIINEPTAAAIAYSLDDKEKIKEKSEILILDLGGGSLDVSILTLENSTIQVKATAGDTHLGGEDFDSCLVDYFVREIKEKHKIDIASKKCALRRLRTACEEAKRTLSSSTEARIKINPMIFEGIDFDTSISRERFEELCEDLFNRINLTLEKVFQDPVIQNVQIDDIVLVGGSTRIPKVQKLVRQFFNDKKLNNFKSIDVDEAVAYGAAVLAAKLQGDESDVIQHLEVLDVTPFSLRIETAEGKTEVVIPSNSSIPSKMTPYVCTTSVDNQASMAINVYEDDHVNNNLLGKFILSGIPPAHRGNPSIEIHLVVDHNGILNVSAVAKSSGGDKSLSISSETGWPSRKEIERMANNALRYLSDDEKERERMAFQISLESYCSKVWNMLRNEKYKDKFLDADKKSIIKKCNETDKWLQNILSAGLIPSKDELKRKLKDLEFTMQCIPICNIEDKKEKDRVAAINSLKSYFSQIDLLVDDRGKNVMKKRNDITCWLNTNPSADKEEIELKRKDLELTFTQYSMADFSKLEAKRADLNNLPDSDYTDRYKAFRSMIGRKISHFMDKLLVPDLSLGHATSLKLYSLLDDLTEGSQNIPLYGEPYKLDRAPWNDMVSCIIENSKPKRRHRNEHTSDLTDLEKLKGMGLAAVNVIKKVLSPDPADNLFRGFLQSLDSLETLDFSIKSEGGLIEQKQHSDEIKKTGTVIIASFEYKFTCRSSSNVGSEKSQVNLTVLSRVWDFPTISDMKEEYLKITQE